MKGSPRSLWLSMANRSANQAIGYWTGLFTAAAKRNQATMLTAMTKPPKAPSKAKRASKKKGR
jgi:hypothetical protein